MFKSLASNPRTSLAGLGMILTGVVHIIFAVSHHNATESDITTTVLSIVTGYGLFAAGDAAKPPPPPAQPPTPPTT